MNFIRHSELIDEHAFLGASKYSWLNYDDERLKEVYRNAQAVQRGTELHEFAKRCIELKIPLTRIRKTLNMYVNDALKFGLRPEQPLFYSRNCFGTADAISFDEQEKFLRIHDLKTGTKKAQIDQLQIYAALFCLEYNQLPDTLSIELRIYQNDEILVNNPSSDRIADIMRKIIHFDEIIEKMKLEE